MLALVFPVALLMINAAAVMLKCYEMFSTLPSKLPIKYDLFEGTILLADGDLLYIPYDSASAVFPLKAICS